jgi:hypothetical protein
MLEHLLRRTGGVSMSDAANQSSPGSESTLDQVLGNLLAKICSHEAIDEAMATCWDDICTDTGCHPLDITHGKNKHLTFSPNHWANQIAKRLFMRALKLRLEMAPQSVTVAQGQPDSGEIAHLHRCISMAMGCLHPLSSNVDERLAWQRLSDAIEGREPRSSVTSTDEPE